MGSVKFPNWQVFGPLGLAKAMLGSMLDISVPGPLGGVQQALVYSLKEYVTARAAWRKDRPRKGHGKGSSNPPPQRAASGGGGDSQPKPCGSMLRIRQHLTGANCRVRHTSRRPKRNE